MSVDWPEPPPRRPSSPLAQTAREAFDRGDKVFQCELELQVLEGKAADLGAGTYSSTAASNANPTLNAIATEGWSLVSSSTSFVPESTDSRNRFLTTGQATAVSGRMIGVYVFARQAELDVLR